MNLSFSDKEDLKETHFFVHYTIQTHKRICDAEWDLAIGQSVGNPKVRNRWETEELFTNHSCKILSGPNKASQLKNGATSCIAFPYINLDWETDGISQLLCMVQGGHTDIAHIVSCRVVDIEIPKLEKLTPKFGLSGLRKRLGQFDKPLLGGIIKPKTGVSKFVLLDMVKQMIDGGIDFIKEDEILSNPAFCRIEERTELIMNYLNSISSKVIYSVCINSDTAHILNRVKTVHSLGGNSVHINIWAGLGVYKSIRELDLPIFIHYQKSGIQAISNHGSQFGIDWSVICKLAAVSGIDSIHVGMLEGYSKNPIEEILPIINMLREHNIIPALSCGMHPGLVEKIKKQIGIDWMANCGGAIHGHPGGTLHGTKAMREAIDGKYSQDFGEAINTWGFIK